MATSSSSQMASAGSTGSATTANIVEKKSSTTVDEAGSKGLYDGDDSAVLDFGGPASATDEQAIIHLLQGYYADAAAEDGKAACSELDSLTAESIVENYGHTRALQGSTCTAVISKLFTQQHRQLAIDNSSLKILAVKVEGHRALAIMKVASDRAARYIPARREGRAWKIVELLDSPLP